MAESREEWLIWDRRFQYGFGCLNQRLNNNEEATQHIASLEQQIELLEASKKHLQEANDGLRDRVQKLEQASHQITQLDEQVKDLTASCQSLKEENNALNDRTLQLEQESTHRDQENRRLLKQQEEKLHLHDGELQSVIISMSGMNEIARVERRQRGEDIQQLRSQVEALIATRHTLGGHGQDVSRGASQATTEDEWEPVDQHNKQQPHRDIEIPGLLIKTQASFTPFKDHLKYVEETFERWEQDAVQAFVSSVQEGYRTVLRDKLEKCGDWTWQAAREEGHRIVENNEKKAKRRSARLMAASSQPL